MRSNHGRSEWIVHGAAVIWLSDDHGKEEEERVVQHGHGVEEEEVIPPVPGYPGT